MKGHIRKRGKRSWAVILDIGEDLNGKRRQKWHSVKGTKKDAEDELARLINELRNGIYVESHKISTKDFLLKWLEHIKSKVAPSTHEGYEAIVMKYLIPKLGRFELTKLKPLHIESFYAEALKNGRLKGTGGLSKQTVLHFHRVLKEALNQAVKWKMLTVNPCHAVEPPKPDRFEIRALDSDASLELLEAIKESCVYPATFFAVMTGLRRGEVLGLRWQDVDLQNGVLHVMQTVQQIYKRIEFRQPKTNRSRRPVIIPQIALDMLRKHKASQAENRLALGAAYQNNGLVFAREDGSPWSPDAFTSAYRSAVAIKFGKKVRFHDLRHSHATQLLKQGVHPKVVSERLGHSSISITMDIYSHVLPGMQEEAASKIDAAFREVMNKQRN